MCKFGVATVAEAMKLGKIAAEAISKTFVDPIKLEFEKVISCFLVFFFSKYLSLQKFTTMLIMLVIERVV